MMSSAVVVVLLAVCLNNPAGAQTKRDIPTINILGDKGVLLVMTSANLTIKGEDKDKGYSHGFVKAVPSVTVANGTVKALLSFNVTGSAMKDWSVSKFDVAFNFTKDGGGGYWSLLNLTVDLTGYEGKPDNSFAFKGVPLFSEIGLYAPDPLSFHCSRFGPVFPPFGKGDQRNHSFVIDFLGFQVEPFMKSANGTVKFSGAFECVGFFSIGILSGIFVTLILMAVIVWGLSMILDVKTMDRFDDPKGKQVSFGGTE